MPGAPAGCPPLFGLTLIFSEGYAAAKQGGCWGPFGFIDQRGRFVIEPRFPSASVFREDLAIIGVDSPGSAKDDEYLRGVSVFGDYGLDYHDKKYGYIHKSGVVVIPPQFAGAGVFSEGLAAVEIDAKCGYIDKSGRVVIPPQYDTAHPFSTGIARVSLGDKMGYIDKVGRYVWTPTN